MAMTLRIPEELDRQLEELAAKRHTSKHALIIQAVSRFAQTEDKTSRAIAAVDEITDQYADALKRLEDA